MPETRTGARHVRVERTLVGSDRPHDTMGLLIVVLVTAASVQDRDGGALVLNRARMSMPSIVLV